MVLIIHAEEWFIEMKGLEWKVKSTFVGIVSGVMGVAEPGWEIQQWEGGEKERGLREREREREKEREMESINKTIGKNGG